MEDEKYLKAIEKLATGYEYEEIQTLIEETESGGQKKKVTRTKKHIPPNFQAAKFMLNKNRTVNVTTDNIQGFETEEFGKESF